MNIEEIIKKNGIIAKEIKKEKYKNKIENLLLDLLTDNIEYNEYFKELRKIKKENKNEIGIDRQIKKNEREEKKMLFNIRKFKRAYKKAKKNGKIDIEKFIEEGKKKITIKKVEEKFFANIGKIHEYDNEMKKDFENNELYVNGKLIDNFKGFKQYNFELKGVNNNRKFYEIINEEKIKNNIYDANLVLTLKNKEGKYKRATVRTDFMQTYDDFENWIFKMENNEAYGSDPDENRLEGYKINFAGFQLNKFEIYVHGKNDFLFGDEVDLKNEKYYKKNECMKNSIIYYNGIDDKTDEITDSIVALEHYYRYDKNKQYVVYHDFPENEKFDAIRPDVKWWDYEDENKLKYVLIKYDNLRIFKCNIEKDKSAKGYDEMINNNKTIHKYIYHGDHIAPLKCVNKDNKYYNSTMQLFKFNEKNIMKKISDRRNINMGRKEEFMKETIYTEKYIVFDIETIFDAYENGLLKAYSLSYSIFNKYRNSIKNSSGFFFGDNVCDRFIDEIYNNEMKDCKIILMGYNNANFDNYYIVKSLGKKMDLINDIFYSKNSILNIKFGGRHESFDMCKWTICSLKKASNDFKLIMKKVGDFDHTIIQEHYNKYHEVEKYFHNEECEKNNYEIKNLFPDTNGKKYKNSECDYKFNDKKNNEFYDDVFKNAHKKICNCERAYKLFHYNMYDCYSVFEIYEIIEDIMRKTVLNEDEEIYNFKTIGSFIYKKFMNAANKKNIKLPLLNMQYYKHIRDYLTAGRCECFKGICYDKKNIYDMVDVVSLYPSQMLSNYYPYGEIYNRYYYDEKKEIKFLKIDDEEKKIDYEIKQIDYDFYKKNMNDKIGFFWCAFTQTNLENNILPLRFDRKTNKKLSELNWKYKDVQKQFLNTVDIQQLIDYKCNIKCGNGIIFSEKIKGDEIFDVIKNFKKLKQYEDDLKNKNDEKYNNAAREMYKIILNSLSGKVIEGIHTEQTKYINNESELKKILNDKFEDREFDIKSMDIMQKIDEDHFIIKYKISDEKALIKNNRPIYLGVMIYTYARKLMYDRIISISKTIKYGDTDSALIEHDELLKIMKNHPDYFGKEFGQFDIEKKGINNIVILQPKNYFLFIDDEIVKKGFKGMNIKSDIKNSDKMLFFKDVKKYCDKIKNGYKLKFNIDPFDLYYNKLINNSLSLQINIEKMINILKKDGKCYIMKSYLTKVKHDIMIDKKTGIYQNYNITKIKI
jgi:hypothetical protein